MTPTPLSRLLDRLFPLRPQLREARSHIAALQQASTHHIKELQRLEAHLKAAGSHLIARTKRIEKSIHLPPLHPDPRFQLKKSAASTTTPHTNG